MANPEKLRTPQSVQTKVLLLNAKGFSNRRIARDLDMRPETVSRILKTNKSGQGLSVIDAMNAYGITPEYLAQKLKERTEATEIKVFNNDGQVIYSTPLTAWKVQHEAQDMIHKLRGDYAEQKLTVSGTLFHRLLANVPRPALPK